MPSDKPPREVIDAACGKMAGKAPPLPRTFYCCQCDEEYEAATDAPSCPKCGPLLPDTVATRTITEGPFWAVMLPDGTLAKVEQLHKSPVWLVYERTVAGYEARSLENCRVVRVRSVTYEVEV